MSLYLSQALRKAKATTLTQAMASTYVTLGALDALQQTAGSLHNLLVYGKV
jgi:hypothetical protein